MNCACGDTLKTDKNIQPKNRVFVTHTISGFSLRAYEFLMGRMSRRVADLVNRKIEDEDASDADDADSVIRCSSQSPDLMLRDFDSFSTLDGDGYCRDADEDFAEMPDSRSTPEFASTNTVTTNQNNNHVINTLQPTQPALQLDRPTVPVFLKPPNFNGDYPAPQIVPESSVDAMIRFLKHENIEHTAAFARSRPRSPPDRYKDSPPMKPKRFMITEIFKEFEIDDSVSVENKPASTTTLIDAATTTTPLIDVAMTMMKNDASLISSRLHKENALNAARYLTSPDSVTTTSSVNCRPTVNPLFFSRITSPPQLPITSTSIAPVISALPPFIAAFPHHPNGPPLTVLPHPASSPPRVALSSYGSEYFYVPYPMPPPVQLPSPPPPYLTAATPFYGQHPPQLYPTRYSSCQIDQFAFYQSAAVAAASCKEYSAPFNSIPPQGPTTVAAATNRTKNVFDFLSAPIADDFSTKRMVEKDNKWRTSLQSAKFIDAHCHLDKVFAKMTYTGDFAAFKLRYATTWFPQFAGCVTNFCQPSSFFDRRTNFFDSILSNDDVWGAVGCHPLEAASYDTDTEAIIISKSLHPKVVAIGELGLDYSCAKPEREHQRWALERQLMLIMREVTKPLVLHCREAEEDCFPLLKRMLPRTHPIYWHCFNESMETFDKWQGHFTNLFFGVSSNIFEKQPKLDEFYKTAPLNRLLIETNSPYFLPRHYQKNVFGGLESNHPGLGLLVGVKLAELRGMREETVLDQLFENSTRMYGVP